MFLVETLPTEDTPITVKLATLVKSAAFVVAVSFAVAAPTGASASIFGDIAHAVKKVAHTVAKDVSHPKQVVKDVGRAVDHVDHDVTHPKNLVKDLKQIKVGKIVKSAGDAVGTVYHNAAKAAEHIAVAKAFAPLARDFSRATRTVEGRWAGVAGAGLAVATGGASHAATQAGGWAYAAYLGRKGYNAGRAQLRSAQFR